MTIRKAGFARPVAVLVSASMLSPLIVGCGGGGGGGSEAQAPGIDAPRTTNLPRPVGAPNVQKPGITGKQKMMMLAGAAALYYMYKKHQNAQGQTVQYYKSETNGRIYYRDPKTKQAIYVTPPRTPIQVPMNESQDYAGYQGFNNSPAGQTFGGYGANGPVSGNGAMNGNGAVPVPMR